MTTGGGNLGMAHRLDYSASESEGEEIEFDYDDNYSFSL
jgi:hypothetical protein